ncbi:integral membrane protein [Fusarium austroafricanum]|uniref:Integral membrane protein n=1 Tax=Fusarium austroafricanum TaxID=2364996 RepID=A0A8H4KCM6_9HYPO|nr:integral membrane protein [Fusarium austroafricanum]
MAGFLTGEQIQSIADGLPPITPKNLGPAVEGLAIAFGAVSVIAVCLRIYIRAGLSGVSPRVLGIEDYLAILAALLLIPAVVFSVLGVRYGSGCRDENLPNPFYLIRVVEYQAYWVPFYFIASTIIKCAIGFTCTRLDGRKRVIIPIYINMAVIVIVTILGLSYIFANCKPFAATWNPLLGKCQTKITAQTVSYIASIIQMATDWVSAIIPFFIVWELQMSLRRKVSIILILSLGILASVAVCVRLPATQRLSRQNFEDSTSGIAYSLGIVTMTSNLEVCLGIIASSLPPLRKFFKFYYGSSQERSHPYTRDNGDGIASSGQGIRLGSITRKKAALDTTARSGTQDGETDDDSSSRRGIIRRTDLTIEFSSAPTHSSATHSPV